MHRVSGLLVVMVAFTCAASTAQTPQAPSAVQAPQSVAALSHTQRVIVDVAVHDQDGHPVPGLKPNDFHLTEDNVPQTLLQVEEHTAGAPLAQDAVLPPMPPGTFTDDTPVPPGSTLNILLFDALNTPMKDLGFIRYQLQEYEKHAVPRAHTAIFVLANHLILLQGFTSDPATLKDVMQHKLIPRASSLSGNPAAHDASAQSTDTNAPDMVEIAANLQEFDAQTGALETEFRAPFTLDAFNTLGRYLSAFPGHKNVLWISGSFPLDLFPTAAEQKRLSADHVDEAELRRTADLLAQGRMAISPIDARALTSPPLHAADPKSAHARKHTKSSNDLHTFRANETAVQATMNALASSTGGTPYVATPSLADIVAKAIDDSASYYTLSYRRTGQKPSGAFHEIHIDAGGPAATSGTRLSYGRGVYAESAESSEQSATSAGEPDPYLHAAMSRGAPNPEDILFKVRVLPASIGMESSIAPGNTLDSSVSPKGPFRRYDVDYASWLRDLTLTTQPDGHHTGAAEYLVYLFDVNGRLLNAAGKQINLNLSPANYERYIQSAMELHLEISVPTSIETFLRIGIQDIPTHKFGVVEVPTSSVSHLPPAVYEKAPEPAKPARAPSTSQPPSAIPSTPRTSGAEPATAPPS